MSLLEPCLQSQLSPCQSHSQRKMTVHCLYGNARVFSREKGLRRDGGRRDVGTCTFTQGNMTRQSSDLFCSWLPLVWHQFLEFIPSKCQNCSAHLQLCQMLVKSIWVKTKTFNTIGGPHNSRSFYVR